MADYGPSLQARLLRVGATPAGLAKNRAIPSLGLLASAYGDETPVEWLVIQLGTLNDFAEVRSKISNAQIYELACLILSGYGYLNAAEIQLFIARFKTGRYGRFYGAVDPLKITSALQEYAAERRSDLDRYEREQQRRAREEAAARKDSNAIPYTEYLRLRRLAEEGDEEARKILRYGND